MTYTYICSRMLQSTSCYVSDDMSKLLWAKLRSQFTRKGRSPKEPERRSSDNLIVNEEYMKAFRTNSYVEMWSKIEKQLRISVEEVDALSSGSLSSSLTLQKRTSTEGIERDCFTSPSTSQPFHVDLSGYLFEPETLRQTMETLNFHNLLIDYFNASLEACDICEVLLRCIHQIRNNYQRIKRVIKLSERVRDSSADFSDKVCRAMFRELAAYALLRNPLWLVRPVQLRDIHDKNMELLGRLTSQQRKIRRRTKFNRIYKKVGGYALVVSHTALLIALLVIALHGLIGIVAPGIAVCASCLFKKKIKSVERLKASSAERLSAQLDLAAKGTYIFINSFDTMTRLIGRLNDEIEHRKALADMCVRSEKPELLKEVVRELCIHDSSYLDQLEELEQHTCLCFHTINRSRRLVIQEIMVAQQQCS